MYIQTYILLLNSTTLEQFKTIFLLGAGVSGLLRQLRVGVRLHGQVRRAVGRDQR